MSVKLLTEHHLEFLSFTGGCTGSSETTHVKMPLCWKSHVAAHFIMLPHTQDHKMKSNRFHGGSGYPMKNKYTCIVMCPCVCIFVHSKFSFGSYFMKALEYYVMKSHMMVPHEKTNM